jgi:hypothetical protein
MFSFSVSEVVLSRSFAMSAVLEKDDLSFLSACVKGFGDSLDVEFGGDAPGAANWGCGSSCIGTCDATCSGGCRGWQ